MERRRRESDLRRRRSLAPTTYADAGDLSVSKALSRLRL
jgi:hypothetical protein